MLPAQKSKPYRKQLLGLSLIGFCVLLPLVNFNSESTATLSTASSEGPLGEDRELMASADALRANWKEADLRASVAKYDQAALILTSNADDANASQATLKAASVCFYLSDFAGALERYKSVASVGEKTGDRLAQGRALSQIGRLESYMGNNNLAQQHSNQALILLKPAANDSNQQIRGAYGEALANMGEVSYSKGNFVTALDQFKAALGYLDHDREVQARAHRFIGYLKGSLGNLAGVEPEISQALELSRSINDRAGEGLALSLLGLFYAYTGRLMPGIELQRQALGIFHAIGDRHSEAIALSTVAQAYQAMKNYDDAIINYEKALSLFESTGSLDLVPVTTLSLAIVYRSTGKHGQALKYFDRSLALSRVAGKRRIEANALSQIALVYAAQDRPAEAASQFRKAQQYYQPIGDRRGQAIALNNFGDFLLRTGKNQQALEAYTEALPLSEQVRDNDLVTTSLRNVARAQTALGNHDVALSFIERSIKIIEDLRANVGTPDLRSSFFSGVREHYDSCRDILMQLDRVRPGQGFAQRAFLVSETSRARSLIDLVTESRFELREGAAAELLHREREVEGSIRNLAEYRWELSLDGKGNSTEVAEVDGRLAELRVEYQEIQAHLRTQNLKQASRIDFELQDVAQVQKALEGSDTMLLEYSLGAERSYLWAVTANSFQSYELPNGKTLEDGAKELYELITARQKLDTQTGADYQASVEAADQQVEAKSASLGQSLLGPVAQQLGNKRLLFVTEGALQLVPFEALTLPALADGPTGPKRFLLETNEVVFSPSMSTLIAIRAAKNRPASPDKVVAVIADPVFSSSDDRVQGQQLSPVVAHAASGQAPPEGVLRGANLGRLVHSSEEADAISAAAPRGTSFVAKGFDASRETAMSSQLGEYQIIHFATHGVVNSEHQELSAMVFSTVDQNGVRKNGLMSLYDIYNLDLSADLTVLSACQTALGKDVKGEGLVGLSHSFMSAGSKSVVASLWQVDDRPTAILMGDFYHSMLRDDVAPATALRTAKLKMIADKRWSAPYHWAGFVFQGDYENRIEIQSNSRFSQGLALVALVLISLGLIVFLRRKRRTSPAEQ